MHPRKSDAELLVPYRQTKRGGRRMDVHRAVMQDAVGRPLDRFEFVHHVDHDKKNNALDNLEIMTPKEHAAHHNQKHPLTKTCAVCGVEFTPHPTKRARAKTCSRDCGLLYLYFVTTLALAAGMVVALILLTSGRREDEGGWR